MVLDHIQDKTLTLIVVLKQYRKSHSCSARQVLPKIPQIHGETPAPESRLKVLFKKKPHCSCLPRESDKTSNNTPVNVLYSEKFPNSDPLYYFPVPSRMTERKDLG